LHSEEILLHTPGLVDFWAIEKGELFSPNFRIDIKRKNTGEESLLFQRNALAIMSETDGDDDMEDVGTTPTDFFDHEPSKQEKIEVRL